MSKQGKDPALESFLASRSTLEARPSADELRARYSRIRRRQRVLAAIGIALLILLYVVLRYVLPQFATRPPLN